MHVGLKPNVRGLSVALGSIHRQVRIAEHLVCSLVATIVHGNANRTSNVKGAILDRECIFQCCSHSLRDPDSTLFGSVANDEDAKLIATQPRDQVFWTHAVPQAHCNMSEEYVTGSVSARVVYRLEPVEIEENDSHVTNRL